MEETRIDKDESDRLEQELREEKKRELAQEYNAELFCNICGEYKGDCACESIEEDN